MGMQLPIIIHTKFTTAFYTGIPPSDWKDPASPNSNGHEKKRISTGKVIIYTLNILNYICSTAHLTIGRKRKRCGKSSKAEDCRECKFCVDKPKYGGPGKLKQVCKGESVYR